LFYNCVHGKHGWHGNEDLKQSPGLRVLRFNPKKQVHGIHGKHGMKIKE